ncbi:MAG: amylopullulanase [Fibrobacteres bacterium]|nr:amylopullulanase [Fibrobacterota bacterium]
MNRLGKNAFGLAALILLAAAVTVRATGFLTLESSPTGAEVWYTGPDDPDKKYLGDTPLDNRELPVGRYNLWLILASHDTLAIPDVYIAEGQVTQMNREIPTHYGYLEVNTDPDSSEIWLDGVRIGPSPYVNNLVLPGVSQLKVMPREAIFKNTTRNLNVGKGDSIRLVLAAPYRDKSFFQENLSLPTWRFQLEAGVQYRSNTGFYDTAGKKVKFSSDSLPYQWDFPVMARLGLPQGFEIHLQLPFNAHKDPRFKTDTISVFPANMRAGVKYTYRPLNVGFDMTYGLGFDKSTVALDHDFLALTLIGMASKGKILGEAQAGFEFHFSSKADNKLDPGDMAFVHAQAGYLLDPLTPYLGVSGKFKLQDDYNGKAVTNSDGYLLIPEPGLIVDVADLLSLQFGVPFTIVGKSASSYWGIHLSASVGLPLM